MKIKIDVIEPISKKFGLFMIYTEVKDENGIKSIENFRIENFCIQPPNSPFSL